MAEVATNEIDLGWDPGRVLFGLSRIGYTPASAICDLVDNSVRAEAENVHVLIRKEREDVSDRRRNNVREYVIIDDGDGMDEAGLQDALKLGSPGEEYEDGALAKFGLGLKAAALSQGEQLELISAVEGGPFRKRVLSLPAVQASGKYFASEVDPDATDRELIDKYLSGGHGTIVRIAEVRKENHPSVRTTIKNLNEKAGVIYYYFIEEGLQIKIDDERVEPFDVLFTEEADENGKLNEHEWDGRTVRWIQKPKDIMLDADSDVGATIEVTQLPYPPIFELEERGQRAATRERYRIDADNYGLYVYRNKRLISWAERFNVIGRSSKLYGFRGRLLIDDSADDAFNIDVKKASITLSDDAERTLDDYSAEYKSKSRTAWKKAGDLKNEREGDDTNLRANQMAEGYTPPDELPGEGWPTEEEAEEQKARDSELRDEMLRRLRKEAADRKREEAEEDVEEDDLTDEELDEALREDANPAAHKIFRVSRVEDNALWEPYYDAENGTSVRINKYHRFGRLIYEDNFENADLQVLFDLMLLQFAESEVYARTKLTSHEKDAVKEITAAYRRFASEFLAGMCRKLGDKLPRSDA